MSGEKEIPTVLTLELRSAVCATVDHSRLGRMLRDAAREELERLGLPGVPRVRMPEGDGSRAVRIRLNGVLVPYPPDLLARVWQGVAPRELHLAALDAERTDGFPDTWLDETRDPPVLVDVLVGLTVALMRRRPDALLSDKALEAYVGEIHAVAPETRNREIPWGAILRPLIRLTGTLANRPAVASAVLGPILMGLTQDDVVESAFASLRGDGLEILWNSGLADWRADAAADLDRRLVSQLGLPVPAVRLLEGVGVDPRRVEVLTAGLPGVPAAMIGREELLVEADALDGVEATTILHPVTGARALVVGADDGDEVIKAGFATVDAKRLAIGLLARELMEQRARLVSISEVEHQLALLRARVPAVVGAAVATFPLAELTRIARLLVEDGISMGDLKGTLDRLLDHEASRPRRPPVLEEPSTVQTNRGTPNTPGAHDYAEAVRAARGRGLAPSVGTVSVINVQAELEDRLASEPAGEQLAHEIRDAIWSVLPADENPVVVTSAPARRALRVVLADELPSLEVISDAELAPDVDRLVVGTIAL